MRLAILPDPNNSANCKKKSEYFTYFLKVFLPRIIVWYIIIIQIELYSILIVYQIDSL